MSELGICKITGSETGNPLNIDSGTVTYLHVENAGGTKKIQLYGSGGVDHTPQPNDVAIKTYIGEIQTAIIATADKVAPSTAAGETRIYAYDANDNVKSEIWWYVDGKIVMKNDSGTLTLTAAGHLEFNGNTKQFVTWQELQTVLTSLQASLISHVHPSNGAPSPGLAALSLDISSAKTTTVVTGG